MNKHYKEPQFHLVSDDERNKVFFAASGAPEPPTVGGSITSMSSTNGAW